MLSRPVVELPFTSAQDRVGYKTLLDSNALRHTCQHGRPGKWAAIIIQDEYNESKYEAYEYIYAPVGPLIPTPQGIR